MSKHKLNIHYRGSPWGSRTQQHAYCLRYAHSQHTESHLGKKQPQAKIPIAFLFSQLHFNNVTLHALFYSGHLIMRSAKQGNHLNSVLFPIWCYVMYYSCRWELLQWANTISIVKFKRISARLCLPFCYYTIKNTIRMFSYHVFVLNERY